MTKLAETKEMIRRMNMLSRKAAQQAATREAIAYLMGFGFKSQDMERVSGKGQRAIAAALKVEMSELDGTATPQWRIREALVEVLRDAIKNAVVKNQGRKVSTRAIAQHVVTPYNADVSLRRAVSGMRESLSTN